MNQALSQKDEIPSLVRLRSHDLELVRVGPLALDSPQLLGLRCERPDFSQKCQHIVAGSRNGHKAGSHVPHSFCVLGDWIMEQEPSGAQ